MKTLILDQYAQQSGLKQFLGNTLTGLAWSFWVYLWLPLIVAISLLIEPNPEQTTSTATHSLMALGTTLSAHASMVAVMIGFVISWAILQWAGKKHRRIALQKKGISSVRQQQNPAHSATDLQRWKQAQCMVVSHDDAGGIIERVNVVNHYSKAVLIHCPSISVSSKANPTINPYRERMVAH
jgi:poly-beta-1,6-N-acetyl-D-glucosamine biosynthesis protein PgaD